MTREQAAALAIRGTQLVEAGDRPARCAAIRSTERPRVPEDERPSDPLASEGAGQWLELLAAGRARDRGQACRGARMLLVLGHVRLDGTEGAGDLQAGPR